MTLIKTIKILLALLVSSVTWAGIVMALVAILLVLLFLPGGLAILTLEHERTTKWLRRLRFWLFQANFNPKTWHEENKAEKEPA